MHTSKEMSQKSTTVSLPIINANKAKYEDCVKNLRTPEKWIAEIHLKARLLEEMPHTDNPPVRQGPAAPGQADAHNEGTDDEPMREK